MGTRTTGGVLVLILSLVAICGAWARSSGDDETRQERGPVAAEADNASAADDLKVVQELQRELRRRLQRGRSSPKAVDTSAENWRTLSERVGLLLFTDGAGIRRATLYVRSEDETWEPVALEGIAELGRKLLPAG